MGREPRAVLDTGDRHAFAHEPCRHPVHQVVKLLRRVEPARDAGLVGDDHDRQVQPHGGAAEIENAGDEFDPVRPVDVTAVDVDDTVAIEEQAAAREKGNGHACLGILPKPASGFAAGFQPISAHRELTGSANSPVPKVSFSAPR